jgi:hypothetical protein
MELIRRLKDEGVELPKNAAISLYTNMDKNDLFIKTRSPTGKPVWTVAECKATNNRKGEKETDGSEKAARN